MNKSDSWTLETELCKLSNCESINEALKKLGIIKKLNTNFVIHEGKDGWYRGGAETYLYKFSISNDSGLDCGLLLKACVAYSPSTKLEGVLDVWIERRKLINNLGIETPKLFAYAHGVILEEYIPYSVKDIINTGQSNPEEIVHQLALVTAILLHQGFFPIDMFKDLRSRGRDVVMIDFGEDLGPPVQKNSNKEELIKMLFNQFNKWDVAISNTLKEQIYSIIVDTSEMKI